MSFPFGFSSAATAAASSTARMAHSSRTAGGVPLSSWGAKPTYFWDAPQLFLSASNHPFSPPMTSSPSALSTGVYPWLSGSSSSGRGAMVRSVIGRMRSVCICVEGLAGAAAMAASLFLEALAVAAGLLCLSAFAATCLLFLFSTDGPLLSALPAKACVGLNVLLGVVEKSRGLPRQLVAAAALVTAAGVDAEAGAGIHCVKTADCRSLGILRMVWNGLVFELS